MPYADEALNRKVDSTTNKFVPSQTKPSPPDLARLRDQWQEMNGIPKLVPARIAGIDNSFLDFDVRTLLRGEESGGRHSVHSIIVPPSAEIPAHGYESGDAAWFVLSGELEIRVGALKRNVKAPAFAYAPEQTTHAIANRSNAPAEVLVIHSPAGADCAFEAAHRLFQEGRDVNADDVWAMFAAYGFTFSNGKSLANDRRVNEEAARVDQAIESFEDFAALRDRWRLLAPTPKIVDFPQQCRNIPVPDQETRVLLTPEESRAHASVLWGGLQNGFGAPVHHQPSEDEFFVVLEGSLRLGVGNLVEEDARHGAFGYAPRYATHFFESKVGSVVTLFTMNSPGGHERGFEFAVRERGSPGFLEGMEARGYVFHQTSEQ